MFYKQRQSENRYEERKKSRQETLSKATAYVRAVVSALDGATFEVDDKKGHFDCSFTTTTVTVTCWIGHFELFEKMQPYMDSVKKLVRDKMRFEGYSTCPDIQFEFT